MYSTTGTECQPHCSKQIYHIISSANNKTALQYAAESDNVDIIKLLLDNGLSVNMANSNDSTPLHISAECGHLEATKFLVYRGAAINNTNKYGNTPHMVAAEKG
jgi:ankyrin repeat protein